MLFRSSNPTDNNWGFQFLWNPTTISSTVSRNSNVVPSPTDKFNGIAGIFTAMEQIQFTIVLDRVNDFACGKAVGNPALLTPYYSNGFPSDAIYQQNTADQVDELLRKGTMADIEYLFRMINGSGQNGQSWTNALGRLTEIGRAHV